MFYSWWIYFLVAILDIFLTHTHTHTHIHTHTHTHTQIHTHTHTYTHHGVVAVWPLARQGTQAVCKWCDLPVKEPCCNLLLGQGRPSYGWRRTGLLNSSRFIGRAKTDGLNSYGGFGICSTVSRPSSRRVRKPVERCCSCPRKSTCSTVVPSA